MWNTPNETIKTELVKALTEPGKELRSTRDSIIEKCTDIVLKQYQMESNTDVIDSLVASQALVNDEKQCVECGCESDASYRVCRNCGGKIVKETFFFTDATNN